MAYIWAERYLKTYRMKRNDFLKIAVLILLLVFCVVKYSGYFYSSPQKIAIKKEEKRTRDIDINNQTAAFLTSLTAEDLDKATEFATLRGLESVMKIPVDHIANYEIIEIQSDKYSAEVETMVNGSVRTIVYLKKEGNKWLVNSVIPDKNFVY